MKRLLLAILLSLLFHLLAVVIFLSLWSSFFQSSSPQAGGGGGRGGSVSIEIVGNARESTNTSASVPLMEVGKKPSPQIKTTKNIPAGGPQGPGTGPYPAGFGSGPAGGTNDILTQIRARIERAKRYPTIARQMNIQGVSVVHFQIDPSGQPQSIGLKNSSGSSLLDEEALATIRRAAPFPIYEEPLEVGIRFEIVP